MIFKFGSYSHRLNSAGLQVSRTTLLDHKQEPYAVTERWTLDFRLINTGSASTDLDGQIAALQNAYRENATVAQLLHPNGSPTAHNLTAGTTIGGIRVIQPPSFMRFQDGEYVTYRTGNIVLEATVRLTSNPEHVIEFSESLDMEGGGPEYALLQPNVGLAVRQRTRENLKFTATQSGRIVHFGDWGTIPRPIWPAALIRPVKLRPETPKQMGRDRWLYPTSYTYQFESASRLEGTPTVLR